MKVKTQFLETVVDGSPMAVYHARPREERGRFGILVFQEAFGVNGHIQDVCHRLAHEGYEVFAPELFHRSGRHVSIDYADKKTLMDQLKHLTNATLLADIAATIKLARELPDLYLEGFACIGFCVGGFTSILCAEHFELMTAISFYGAGLMDARPGIGLTPLASDFGKIRSPLLLFYGGNDSSIPLTEVGKIQARLIEAGVEMEQVVFPQSNHGFFCSQRGSYDAQAAHVAWEMTRKWLKQKCYSMPERSSSRSSGIGSSDFGASI